MISRKRRGGKSDGRIDGHQPQLQGSRDKFVVLAGARRQNLACLADGDHGYADGGLVGKVGSKKIVFVVACEVFQPSAYNHAKILSISFSVYHL